MVEKHENIDFVDSLEVHKNVGCKELPGRENNERTQDSGQSSLYHPNAVLSISRGRQLAKTPRRFALPAGVGKNGMTRLNACVKRGKVSSHKATSPRVTPRLLRMTPLCYISARTKEPCEITSADGLRRGNVSSAFLRV